MSQSIGFIGLGNMGLPIARNLIQKGFALRVYNRSASKADALVAMGAVRVETPSQVATSGSIVLTMLSDDAALRAVADDSLIRALGPGGIHLSLSTVSPALITELSETHQGQGCTLISGPVFGRPPAAEAAKLWICLAGEAAGRKRVKPVLDAISQGAFEFGDEPHLANVVKLAGNFMIISAVEAMAEVSALVEKSGIPRAAALEMLTKTIFNCPLYTGYARHLIDADFDKVAFAARLALKDMALAQQTAARAQAPMPMLSLLVDRYISALANGRGDMDATAIALGAADDAGLKW